MHSLSKANSTQANLHLLIKRFNVPIEQNRTSSSSSYVKCFTDCRMSYVCLLSTLWLPDAHIKNGRHQSNIYSYGLSALRFRLILIRRISLASSADCGDTLNRRVKLEIFRRYREPGKSSWKIQKEIYKISFWDLLKNQRNLKKKNV